MNLKLFCKSLFPYGYIHNKIMWWFDWDVEGLKK